MDFVVINKSDWLVIKSRLERMELLLTQLTKTQAEIVVPQSNGYIKISDATAKYGISRQTISAKARQFKISRLRAGKQHLLLESELIEALKHKVKAPEIFKKKAA